LRGAHAARRADVVYASATYAAAAAASLLARKPLVAKLVSDPAYERAVRYGVFRGTLEEFQSGGGVAARALRRLRTQALRRARAIVVPSAYLAGLARGWGLDTSRITVLPNPTPQDGVEPEPQAPGTLAFVGRLTAAKALGVALEAVARVPEARLVLVGDGPDREALEQRVAELGLGSRVRFLGARPRDEAVRVLAGSRAAVLSSAWENMPHAAVEALSVGTPVVATAVGGVPEVVRDGENGLLVPPGSPAALADAIDRVLTDDGLRDRLAAAARPSVAHLSREAVYGRLEAMLEQAVRR
jgi:glycosyltransferase involved in cell wall biosynthesis